MMERLRIFRKRFSARSTGAYNRLRKRFRGCQAFLAPPTTILQPREHKKLRECQSSRPLTIVISMCRLVTIIGSETDDTNLVKNPTRIDRNVYKRVELLDELFALVISTRNCNVPFYLVF